MLDLGICLGIMPISSHSAQPQHCECKYTFAMCLSYFTGSGLRGGTTGIGVQAALVEHIPLSQLRAVLDEIHKALAGAAASSAHWRPAVTPEVRC